jgi:hypothetical protein
MIRTGAWWPDPDLFEAVRALMTTSRPGPRPGASTPRWCSPDVEHPTHARSAACRARRGPSQPSGPHRDRPRPHPRRARRSPTPATHVPFRHLLGRRNGCPASMRPGRPLAQRTSPSARLAAAGHVVGGPANRPRRGTPDRETGRVSSAPPRQYGPWPEGALWRGPIDCRRLCARSAAGAMARNHGCRVPAVGWKALRVGVVRTGVSVQNMPSPARRIEVSGAYPVVGTSKGGR